MQFVHVHQQHRDQPEFYFHRLDPSHGDGPAGAFVHEVIEYLVRTDTIQIQIIVYLEKMNLCLSVIRIVCCSPSVHAQKTASPRFKSPYLQYLESNVSVFLNSISTASVELVFAAFIKAVLPLNF